MIADETAREEIPTWESAEAVVTASTSSLVVRVIHEQEGRAVVRLSRSHDSAGSVVFDSTLDIPSGRIRASDAMGRNGVTLSVRPGTHRVQVTVNNPSEATLVEVVVID